MEMASNVNDSLFGCLISDIIHHRYNSSISFYTNLPKFYAAAVESENPTKVFIDLIQFITKWCQISDGFATRILIVNLQYLFPPDEIKTTSDSKITEDQYGSILQSFSELIRTIIEQLGSFITPQLQQFIPTFLPKVQDKKFDKYVFPSIFEIIKQDEGLSDSVAAALRFVSNFLDQLEDSSIHQLIEKIKVFSDSPHMHIRLAIVDVLPLYSAHDDSLFDTIFLKFFNDNDTVIKSHFISAIAENYVTRTNILIPFATDANWKLRYSYIENCSKFIATDKEIEDIFYQIALYDPEIILRAEALHRIAMCEELKIDVKIEKAIQEEKDEIYKPAPNESDLKPQPSSEIDDVNGIRVYDNFDKNDSINTFANSSSNDDAIMAMIKRSQSEENVNEDAQNVETENQQNDGQNEEAKSDELNAETGKPAEIEKPAETEKPTKSDELNADNEKPAEIKEEMKGESPKSDELNAELEKAEKKEEPTKSEGGDAQLKENQTNSQGNIIVKSSSSSSSSSSSDDDSLEFGVHTSPVKASTTFSSISPLNSSGQSPHTSNSIISIAGQDQPDPNYETFFKNDEKLMNLCKSNKYVRLCINSLCSKYKHLRIGGCELACKLHVTALCFRKAVFACARTQRELEIIMKGYIPYCRWNEGTRCEQCVLSIVRESLRNPDWRTALSALTCISLFITDKVRMKRSRRYSILKLMKQSQNASNNNVNNENENETDPSEIKPAFSIDQACIKYGNAFLALKLFGEVLLRIESPNFCVRQEAVEQVVNFVKCFGWDFYDEKVHDKVIGFTKSNRIRTKRASERILRKMLKLGPPDQIRENILKALEPFDKMIED